ncbi:hypothetical protein CAEBREN_08805 [Caenorhabditis brenneri]|uniref:Uncharacterized protein n=1 Tax=Caenorhabditis brenneri TaxID=135651 RepID=G0MLK6_CAEBE|nr:hypothetical protein CAEBREN_08805 [Caenorhabditis brenneri]
MPTRVKYYEKLREKRRLAREKAAKVQEERKRAREVKEEKWTTRNEFELVSEHRKVQRKEYIEKIRKDSQAMLEMAIARVKSHEDREEMIKKDIEDEVETIRNFIDEIYEIFASVFDFDPKMPEDIEVKEDDDQIFAKEIAQLEKEFEENSLKADSLDTEIAKSKVQIETENVKFAAMEQEKAIEIIKLEKQIKMMEAKLDFIKLDPVEIEEIEKLRERVEEETQRNKEYAESLKYIKEMIRIKKAEKEKKKK